jgi:Na+/melibiose symporter-like transporter
MQRMALAHESLSVREKVGYGIGDAAANFIFQTMIIFQLAFYTDTFGITAAAAGTLFLVVRVFDAAFDPLMGVIAVRTNTRWGKFRPWILWTAVPFGIMGFLAFTTPDLSPSGKLVYAYVTYILLMMVYSANNLPYSALSGVMTGDVVQRTSLSSYRMVFAMASQLVIQGLALPMVKQFGGGHTATLQGLGGSMKRGAKLEDVQVGVDEWAGTFRTIPMYSSEENEQAVGIIGLNFLGKFNVVIDFGRMRIDLERR